MTRSSCTLVARSSSHFSRVARIYAHELAVPYDFEPVYDLQSTTPHTYGDNPLMRVPSLRTREGTWFGTLSTCRQLARLGNASGRLLWPEDLNTPLGSNAQEVALDAMATGVVIVTARMAGIDDASQYSTKPRARLVAAIDWLEAHLQSALEELPPRQLSFLEVSSYCLLTHLAFRGLGSLDGHPRLRDFCDTFGQRASARATGYFFDEP